MRKINTPDRDCQGSDDRIKKQYKRTGAWQVMIDAEISFQRLLNQHIDGEKFERPEEVVRWMGAMQAQSYPQALWAIGVRMQSATVADIERAISEAKIVRTWPLRGTIHFVPPEDAKWMLKLSVPRLLARDRRTQEQLGLDEEILERSSSFFIKP